MSYAKGGVMKPAGFAGKAILYLFSVAFLCAPKAFAAGAAKLPVNSGDTAWLIVATAMVFMMTIPGLALFYGGACQA